MYIDIGIKINVKKKVSLELKLYVKYKICFITCAMYDTNNEKGNGNLNKRRPNLKNKFGNYDFFLFTNNKQFKPKTAWDIIYVSNEELDKYCLINKNDNIRKNVYRSRYHKWQGYKYISNVMKKDYDVIFYCDINIILYEKNDWQEYARIIKKKGLIQRRHNIRTSVYAECDEICKYIPDSKLSMDKMKKFLKYHKMPNKSICTENNLFGYDPKSKIITSAFDIFFNNYIILKITYRDQPLWWFILWKLDIKPVFL